MGVADPERQWRVNEEFSARIGCGIIGALTLPVWFLLMFLAVGPEDSSFGLAVSGLLAVLAIAVAGAGILRTRAVPRAVSLSAETLRVEAPNRTSEMAVADIEEVFLGAGPGLAPIVVKGRDADELRVPKDLEDLDGLLGALSEANPDIRVRDERTERGFTYVPPPKETKGSGAAGERDNDDVVLVFAGGAPVGADVIATLPQAKAVIAADSGADRALAAGLLPDLVVGDLDSISPESLAAIERAEVPIDRHPRAKDRTDLALALEEACSVGARRVIVVGGGGGRLDHLVGNLHLLASDEFAEVDLEARTGDATVTIVRDRVRTMRGKPGDLVSLLAVAGPADGVTTSGLFFPLIDATLPALSSLGVSNELVGEDASVVVHSGVVMVIQPVDQTDVGGAVTSVQSK